MAEKASKDYFVFIDDSNLWISGQKAQGAKLLDADNDPRYRVDLGKLLGILTMHADTVSYAFLYGSHAPPNDTVWKAARERNFNVKSSPNGKEKEIAVAMAVDITEMMCDHGDENSIFVIVTGDRDLKMPVEKALKRRISVHLWSWKQSLSIEYQRLANHDERFRVFFLDDVENHFSFKSYIVDKRKRIDPTHAIVITNVSSGRRELQRIANSIARLMRLFFVTSRSAPSKDTQDLIIAFPNTRLEVIMGLLRAHRPDLEFCTYASYNSTVEEASKPLAITNRFEALSEIDDEYLPDDVESSLEIESVSSGYEADISSCDGDTDSLSSGGSLVDVVRVIQNVNHCGSTPCRWGEHCAKGANCKYLHTDYEKEVFCIFPQVLFKYWKTKLCNKLESHTSPELRKWCRYAHTSEDSWCLNCKMYGHLTNDCAVSV